MHKTIALRIIHADIIEHKKEVKMSALSVQLTVITGGNNTAHAVWGHMLTNVWVSE